MSFQTYNIYTIVKHYLEFYYYSEQNDMAKSVEKNYIHIKDNLLKWSIFSMNPQ